MVKDDAPYHGLERWVMENITDAARLIQDYRDEAEGNAWSDLVASRLDT